VRLTIVAEDKVVLVDGVTYTLDLTELDPSIRAVQWDGVRGHVELHDMTNVPLAGIEEFQPIIARWQAAHEEATRPLPPDVARSAEIMDELAAIDRKKPHALTDAVLAGDYTDLRKMEERAEALREEWRILNK